MPKTSARTLVLRPADPFDLIRWLARSQSDPRKAVAELVQNSIDAHARRVVVSRRRLRGGPALTVRDDGEGVLPGLGPAHVELYLARGAERPAIQVSCAGTLVADDVGELHALDLDVPPWVGCELSGLIDFPGFTVPPGSRRGVVPDRGAEAFARAMIELRPLVENELQRPERERRAAADRQVVEELRRALRGLLPQYDLPPVLGARGGVGSDERGAPEPLDTEEVAPGRELELFPAGALATVSIAPDPVEVAPGHEHRARAEARDEDRRLIRHGVAIGPSKAQASRCAERECGRR